MRTEKTGDASPKMRAYLVTIPMDSSGAVLTEVPRHVVDRAMDQVAKSLFVDRASLRLRAWRWLKRLVRRDRGDDLPRSELDRLWGLVDELHKKSRPMRTVIIESPWRAATEERAELHRRYLDACIADCLRLGESPYASHKMLTQALDDHDERQREQGIVSGFMWARYAEARVFYIDIGVSDGMHRGLLHAAELRQVVEYRKLGGEWAT